MTAALPTDGMLSFRSVESTAHHNYVFTSNGTSIASFKYEPLMSIAVALIQGNEFTCFLIVNTKKQGHRPSSLKVQLGMHTNNTVA